MVDASIFFKKIGKNQYIYRHRGIIGKYGYLLTYKEKKAILDLFDTIAMQAMIAMVFIVTYLKIIQASILTPLLFGFLGYVYIKFRVHKIIGKREKVYCGRLTLLEFNKAFTDGMAMSELVKNLLISVIVLVAMFYLFKQSIETTDIELLIVSIIFMIAGLKLQYAMMVGIYFKRKSMRKNREDTGS